VDREASRTQSDLSYFIQTAERRFGVSTSSRNLSYQQLRKTAFAFCVITTARTKSVAHVDVATVRSRLEWTRESARRSHPLDINIWRSRWCNSDARKSISATPDSMPTRVEFGHISWRRASAAKSRGIKRKLRGQDMPLAVETQQSSRRNSGHWVDRWALFLAAARTRLRD